MSIPVDLAKGIIEQLKNDGRVTRAWLGVGIQDLTPELAEYYHVKEQNGALVTQVYEGDPADKAGIKTSDIIIGVNGKKVSSSRDLSRTIGSSPVGDQIPITILREGKEKTVHVELSKRVDSDTPVKVESKSPQGLGLQITKLKPETARRLGLPENGKGVLVTHVQPSGKGEMAGIQPGDVIKKVNRKPVKTPKDVKKQMERVKSGDTVQMLIKRAHAGLVVVKIPV